MKTQKFIPFLFLLSCGDMNIYSLLTKKNKETQIAQDLDRENTSDAKKQALKLLGTDYQNRYDTLTASQDPFSEKQSLSDGLSIVIAQNKLASPVNVVSLLASAVAQENGIDPFDLALSIVKRSTSKTSQSTNLLVTLFDSLPVSNQERVLGLQRSVVLLTSIDTSIRRDAENYKISLLLTALVSMSIKGFDTDGDGKISLAEAQNMTVSHVTTWLQYLTDGAQAVQGTSKELATQMTQVVTEIQNATGSSTLEKFQQFVTNGGT